MGQLQDADKADAMLDNYLVPPIRELIKLGTTPKTLEGIIGHIAHMAEVAGYYGDFITYYKLLGIVEELKVEHGLIKAAE